MFPDPSKSVLEQRSEAAVPPINPINDIHKFIRESETRRQQTILEVEKAKMSEPKWLDVTAPVKKEATFSDSRPRGVSSQFPQPLASGSGITHQWKITRTDTEDVWAIDGGDIYLNGQGTSISVPAGTVSGEFGVIYVQIQRDASTREATIGDPAYGIDATLPESTETYQYFRLGTVFSGVSPLQERFTPIAVYEDLFVVNGAFKLGNLATISENLYDTPP